MDVTVNPKHRFSEGVVRALAEATGIADSEQWYHIMGLVAKSEHDGGPETWDRTDKKGVSVFNYAQALSYDRSQRGVTMGLVGFTTHNDGKSEWGDAQPLFKAYAAAGGHDLADLAVGVTKNKAKADALCKIINDLDDPAWIECQWRELLKAPAGYLHYTMKVLRKRDLPAPKALTVAMIFDHSLNCGSDGKHSAGKLLEQIPDDIRGPADEKKLIKQFTRIRRDIIGVPKFDYNSPRSNGEHRADMITDLLDFMDLKGPGAAEAVQKAIGWTMK